MSSTEPSPSRSTPLGEALGVPPRDEALGVPPREMEVAPLERLLVALALSLSVVAVFLLYIFGGGFLQIINLPFGLWFTEVFIFLGFCWVSIRVTGRSPYFFAKLAFKGWKPLALGFACGTVNYFAAVVPIQALAMRYAPQWVKAHSPDSARVFEHRADLSTFLLFGALALAAPLCEEFSFRGTLQQTLFRRSPSPWKAIVLTAAVFSAFHMDILGFLARLELGILFGFLFWRAGSLWPGVLAHSANNVVTTLLFFLADRGAEAPDAGGEDIPLPLVAMLAGVGLPILFGILGWVARHPSALRGREQPNTEGTPAGSEVFYPRPALSQAVRPWLLGAALSIGGLLAVDFRGCRLNWYDAIYPLPEKSEQSLAKLREAVEHGHAPTDTYRDQRRRLHDALN